MGKLKCLFLMLMLLSVVACQKGKTTGVNDLAPQNTSEDAAVNSVGNDITNADSVEKDLSADNLNDLDSGLTDVENI